MKALAVCGVGLWAPGFPGASAWSEGTRDPEATRPLGRLLPAGMRRRASLRTREVVRLGGLLLIALVFILALKNDIERYFY